MAAVYFEEAGETVRLSVTGKADAVVARMGRAARGAAGRRVLGLVLLDDMTQARKLRRVVTKAWRHQYAGAGQYRVGPEDIARLLGHLEADRGLTCCWAGKRPGWSARQLIFHRFARGTRSRWRGTAETFRGHHLVLCELVAAGYVTKHNRRATGEIEYRGTRKCASVAAAVAREQVPVRGIEPPVEPRNAVTEVIVVPEPQMARAEILHQLEQRREGDKSLHPGYAPAAVNMRLLIGALADVKGLTEEQKRGAQQFRLLAEQAQIGGARAIDYEITRVDTSVINVASEIGADARARFHAARVHLGLGTLRLMVAERMILGDESVRTVVASMGHQGGQARKRVIEVVKDAASELARHFGVMTTGGRKPRFEGERPSEVPEQFRTELAE